MIHQGQKRALAVVQRDEVAGIEHARVAELPQLGVDVAATEHDLRRRALRLHDARDPERAVEVAGERHGQADDVGRVGADAFAREIVEQPIDQRRRGVERIGERIEADRARGELLAVAGQLEAGIDPVTDDVGEVVDEQAGEVSGPVGHAELAERPPEEIVAPPSPPSASSAAKRGPSGRNARPAMRIARLGSWPWRNRTTGSTSVAYVAPRARNQSKRFLPPRAAFSSACIAVSPVARKQPQKQLDRQIRLRHLDRVRRVLAQAPREVRRRRVGRVELGHRRRDEENAHLGPAKSSRACGARLPMRRLTSQSSAAADMYRRWCCDQRFPGRDPTSCSRRWRCWARSAPAVTRAGAGRRRSGCDRGPHGDGPQLHRRRSRWKESAPADAGARRSRRPSGAARIHRGCRRHLR